MTKNVELDSPEYQEKQDAAANAQADHMTYSDSAEALALKQAFVLGSNTALQFPDHHMRIMWAVKAGRDWGLAEADD